MARTPGSPVTSSLTQTHGSWYQEPGGLRPVHTYTSVLVQKTTSCTFKASSHQAQMEIKDDAPLAQRSEATAEGQGF